MAERLGEVAPPLVPHRRPLVEHTRLLGVGRVEVAGASRPVPACSTCVAPGMAISTRTPALVAGRRATVELLFAGGARRLGMSLWKGGDGAVIDGIAINGSARLVAWVAGVIRYLQSGFIYHYAFAMLVGVAIVLFFFLTMPYFLSGSAH